MAKGPLSLRVKTLGWLARQEEEEKNALEMFGEAYARYAQGTKRFVPYLV